MKVSHILNENFTIDEVESQPFMDDFDGLELYHSTPKKYHDIHKMEFRFRSKPQTTVHKFHDLVNEYSIEKFDIPIRNLLFCYDEACGMYGFPYRIVPIGSCRMFYAPGINDMTIHYNIDDLDNVDFNIDDFMGHFEKLIPSKYSEKFVKELFSSGSSEVHPSDIEYTLEVLDDEYEGDEYEKFRIAVNDSTDKIIEMIQHQYDIEMKRMAKEYVRNCQEITTYNYDDIDNEEIMLYAPNGFYVIPA